MKKLWVKTKEALISVVPITLIVLILALFVVKSDKNDIFSFIVGAVFVVVGMSFFSLGADVAMVNIGSRVGASLTKTRKLLVIIILGFVIGLIVTIAEPDLLVLAEQLSKTVNKYVLIICVGVGVGVFLAIALLRIIFQIPLRRLLFVFYGIVFVAAIFVPQEFLPLAFDSGGVTTGPMTVPFIMALGIGVAATVGSNKSDDSFGLVALCSVGPIVAVMMLGIFSGGNALNPDSFVTPITFEGGLVGKFFVAMPTYLFEVFVALCPIIVFFLVYNFVALKLPIKYVGRIMFGMLYVYIGLTLFLTGVNVGFSPLGKMLGSQLVAKNMDWLIVPIGMVIGFFIVAAEPAVHVLNEQVEEISNKTITKKQMMISLMAGVSVAVGLALTRVITGISIWWLILPGYLISLLLSFFVPKVFTAVAFDSGGVASGPMTATFLLPFTIGACLQKGGNIFTDAFGVVAMVAMTPLLTIQLLGLVSKIKNNRHLAKIAKYAQPLPVKDGIVTLDKKIEDNLDDMIVFDSVMTVKKDENKSSKSKPKRKTTTVKKPKELKNDKLKEESKEGNDE